MLRKTFLFVDKAKSCFVLYNKNNSDCLCSLYIHYYVINMFIFFKMLLFQLFPSSSLFFFSTKKAAVDSTFHSAAPFSGDGSYCISWKMILRRRLKDTVGGYV